jgi:hypothetical protein
LFRSFATEVASFCEIFLRLSGMPITWFDLLLFLGMATLVQSGIQIDLPITESRGGGPSSRLLQHFQFHQNPISGLN